MYKEGKMKFKKKKEKRSNDLKHDEVFEPWKGSSIFSLSPEDKLFRELSKDYSN